MKVTKDTLGITTDRWSDPGDYPNSLASGPLPDGPEYVEEVYGEVVVEGYNESLSSGIHSDGHLEEFHPELHEMLTERVPDGISVLQWSVESNDLLTFEVNEFDADNWESPEPDYEED